MENNLQLDANEVVNNLAIQVAELSKDNAMLKAQLKAVIKANEPESDK